MARKPGIGTASKKAKTQGRLAQAIAAKQADKAANPPFVAAPDVGRPPIIFPDYRPEMEEIADSLRHIHSTLHILSSALLAWSQRGTVPTLVMPTITEVQPEAPGVTPLGEVKPRRGRPAKVKTEAVEVPAVMAASMREAEEAMAKAEQTPAEQEQAASAAKAEANSTPVEVVPEKAKPVTFEEMRAAAVALAGKENGRARLTAILQAEAGVANLSGVPDEKRAQVVKALTEAANG